MAVAGKKDINQKTSDSSVGLSVASLLGAVYILLGCGAVFYALPEAWGKYVSPSITASLNDFVDVALRVVAQLVLLAVWIRGGQIIAGSNPPRGIRGGLFIGVSVLFTVFFVSRAIAMNLGPYGPSWMRSFSDDQVGQIVWGVSALVLLFFGWRFLKGEKGRSWAVALEDQGWFSTKPYKRTQGLKVRRLTMLGVLLITGSGVLTLMNSTTLVTAPKHWTVRLPYTGLENLTLIPDVRFSLPLILFGLSLWVAYRIVHLPQFADFLIATEAEINKVSWSSRKQLVRDTLVVLATVILMAIFLMFADMFWGWLLSQIGILPGDAMERMVVIDPGDTTLRLNQKLTPDELDAAREQWGEDAFTVKSQSDASATETQVKW